MFCIWSQQDQLQGTTELNVLKMSSNLYPEVSLFGSKLFLQCGTKSMSQKSRQHFCNVYLP